MTYNSGTPERLWKAYSEEEWTSCLLMPFSTYAPHQHAQAPPLTQRSTHSTQHYLEILVQERDHVTLTTQIMSVAHVLGRL